MINLQVRTRGYFCFVLVLAGLVLRPSAGTSQAREVLECLTLSFGEWTAGDERLDLYLPLPTRVELRDSIAAPQAEGNWLYARRWPTDSLRARAFWIRDRDSLTIFFPSWWSTGLKLRLPAVGDVRQRSASVYVDYDPFTPPTTTVAATRVSCRA
jgi:hypothetical protein